MCLRLKGICLGHSVSSFIYNSVFEINYCVEEILLAISGTFSYQSNSLRKKCLHSELFQSAFSGIRIENGEILRIQSECGKMQTRITPSTNTFYAVIVTLISVNLNANLVLPFYFLFAKTKQKNHFLASWWSGSEKYFCVLFVKSQGLLQRYSIDF